MAWARIDREPHSRLLIRALTDPVGCREFTPADWDLLLRTARATRLLGVVGLRLAEAGDECAVPAAVRPHLESQRREDEYRLAMARSTLDSLGRVLGELTQAGTPVVALKGAAYLLRGLPWAKVRNYSDVDLLVPAGELDRCERMLRAAGWTRESLLSYDERYYREWSHEIPPLTHEGSQFELDLHHSIIPTTSRLKPDIAALFASSLPSSEPPFRILAPEDQFLHTTLHLVQDSDFGGMLRDLVDIWLLGRSFAAEPGFAARLVGRARLHGSTRQLWWALHLVRTYLESSDFTSTALAMIESEGPSRLSRALLTTAVPAALFPPGPRSKALPIRVARTALTMRYYWLRFPPSLLALHLSVKAWRTLSPEKSGKVDAAV